MMRLMIAVAMICVLITAGCATSEKRQDISVKKTESKVLGIAFARTLAEMMGQIKAETGELPPEAKNTEFLINQIEIFKKNYPSVFLVSAEEESNFRADRFHDAANKAKMEQSIQRLSQYDVALPRMSRLLIAKFKSDELKGAQLEFAARFLAAQIEELGSS